MSDVPCVFTILEDAAFRNQLAMIYTDIMYEWKSEVEMNDRVEAGVKRVLYISESFHGIKAHFHSHPPNAEDLSHEMSTSIITQLEYTYYCISSSST